MIKLSPLPKTWLLDVDGTIVKHNGHLNGGDELLEGVTEFFQNIPPKDKIILLTSREHKYRQDLIDFLNRHKLRFDELICGLPMGERILINDRKNSGLQTAYAINKKRDEPLETAWYIDKDL